MPPARPLDRYAPRYIDQPYYLFFHSPAAAERPPENGTKGCREYNVEREVRPGKPVACILHLQVDAVALSYCTATAKSAQPAFFILAHAAETPKSAAFWLRRKLSIERR